MISATNIYNGNLYRGWLVVITIGNINQWCQQRQIGHFLSSNYIRSSNYIIIVSLLLTLL